jgi:transcriptional regulator GlxA family with amidase domain
MPQPSASQPVPRIALVALPESTPTALYGLHEVFSAVGVAWTELTGERSDAPRLDARILSVDGQRLTSPVGVQIVPQDRLEDGQRFDVLIVTDLALGPEADPRGRWPREAAWVRRQFEAGAVACSVCTGAVLLAEAGLLDGREATTHWSAAGLFERCYPDVRLRPERILLPAGEGHRIVTAGGASSWEELALYLIARLAGEAEARRCAKVFVIGDRAEGQLPFAAMARPRRTDDAVIADCLRWLADHYAVAQPVALAVQLAGLPERTFKRRFRAATGYAPMEYVQALRVEEAKQLLESSESVVDDIASAVGYEDPAFFRQLFKRRTGVTPARYRQRMRSMFGRNKEGER